MKRGRKRLYNVALERAGLADENGVRTLTLVCIDGRGDPSRWHVRMNATGELIGSIRLEEQDRLSRHASVVREQAKTIAAKLACQLEVFPDLRPEPRATATQLTLNDPDRGAM